MGYWTGGIGEPLVILRLHLFNVIGSQVFPSYITQERGVTKQSALARLKEKRAETRRNAAIGGC
jgi:hypothetical protein